MRMRTRQQLQEAAVKNQGPAHRIEKSQKRKKLAWMSKAEMKT